MSTPATGDLPDWSVLVNPNIKNASVSSIAANNSVQLFQSATPYRIWAAWLDVAGFAAAAYAAAFFDWAARIGDGSGASLLRCSAAIANPGNIVSNAVALQIPGYTPIFSAGFYTTNLITETGAVNASFRGSGGILYSQP